MFGLSWKYIHILKDVPLADVKLKQVGDWFGRRNKSPSAIAGAMSRCQDPKAVALVWTHMAFHKIYYSTDAMISVV